MVSSSSYRSSQSHDPQPGPSSSPTMAIKNAKPFSSKTRAPWPLETFWSSANRKPSPDQPRSTMPPQAQLSQPLGRSFSSSAALDPHHRAHFLDLPLTPPDSADSGFEFHSSIQSSIQPSLVRADPLLASKDSSPPDSLRGSHVKSAQHPQSKNDIFNTPTAWLTPPSRASTLPTDEQATSRSPSKNSLFFSSFGSNSPSLPSPPPPRVSSYQSTANGSPKQTITSTGNVDSPTSSPTSASATASTSQQSIGRAVGHLRRSSLGRASTEECLEEEARIRTTKHVDFRLCPTNEYLLGEGRHCSVYLGSYRPRHDNGPSDQNSFETWRLCAVKRLHADRQSQLLGLEEAFALRRLGLHPNIIQLIDIRDEVEFAKSPQPTPRPSQQPDLAPAGRQGLGLGLPTVQDRHSAQGSGSNHSRSTSDMTGREELLLEAQTHKRALAQEKQAQTGLSRSIRHDKSANRYSPRFMTPQQPESSRLPTPTFVVQGPDGGALDNSRNSNSVDTQPESRYARRSSSPNVDPPRLLILLELLPNNLALYARKHAEHVDLQQWFDWALQMAEAVVFLHDKGCVHADIKKENILLTDDLTIKLCDFNSAVFPNPNDPPRDGLGLGTPAYCAPELSRATGGPGATSFSYPIDIFSLGAVLYSLATGYEPFGKARSVVEMLHRKRLFFESEENDRASRLAVQAGSSPASQNASRHASLRGRPHDLHAKSSVAADLSVSPASPSQLSFALSRLAQPGSARRDASNDSIESVASSITTISGRNPTSLSVLRLLEPTDEPRGLLIPDHSTTPLSRRGSLRTSDIRRAASTGSGAYNKTHSPSLNKAVPPQQLEVSHQQHRPEPLRRYSSYDDQPQSRQDQGGQAYPDGHPAILFPDGERLPNWARELLRSMLDANPSARPTARQVRETLRRHLHCCSRKDTL